MKRNKLSEQYLRNIIFGVEDSLVSTLGLLSGIASVGVSRGQILLTGIVLIFVEAFSMGMGSLLTEHSVQEYEHHREVSFRGSFGGAAAMLVSYLLAGLVPLSPYVFLADSPAFWSSIFATLAGLFILGAISARYLGVPWRRHGVEMLVLGGCALAIGVVVGGIMSGSVK